MLRPRTIFLVFAGAALLCSLLLAPTQSQSTSRRITNTTEEGISINPSISGDARIIGFESTEDVAGAGGTSHFRAIRANISIDPPTSFQMGRTRAVAPAISQDGSRIAYPETQANVTYKRAKRHKADPKEAPIRLPHTE